MSEVDAKLIHVSKLRSRILEIVWSAWQTAGTLSRTLSFIPHSRLS